MQFDIPALHSVWAGERDVLAFVCPLHLIAAPLHLNDEVVLTAAAVHGGADVGHQFELPALAFQSGTVLPRRHFRTRFLIGREHRQPMRRANFVIESPQLNQRIRALPQLFAVLKADRVNDEVRVQVVGIGVSCYKDLMTRPSALRKLSGDGVNLLRSGVFIRRKRLNIVIEVDATRLAVRLFRCQKFYKRVFTIARNATDLESLP